MAQRKREHCPVITGEIPNERWRPIAGYEGVYSVSDHGRVRSEARSVPGKLGSMRALPSRLKQPSPDSSGYLQVLLSGGRARTGRSFRVARLVAEAFIGSRPDGMQICHGNGDKLDNRLTNLRYDTAEANVADRVQHGGFYSGEDAPSAKLNLAVAREIRKATGSLREIAAQFGVCHRTVWEVRNNARWVEKAGGSK